MIRCLQAEMLKLRRSRILYSLVVLPIISILIGSFNFYFNQGVLQKEWYSLWSQVSLFYGELFLPLLIAICCSYIWRIEHFNKNWHMLMSIPAPISNVFLAKLLVIGAMLFFVQGFFCLLYLVAGNFIGLSFELPRELFGWLVRGWFAGLAIGAMQLALSMVIRSFAIPIGIGLCFSFIGLALYVLHFELLIPHSLLTLGMGVLTQAGLPSLFEHFAFFSVNLLYILLSCLFAMGWLRKKDVIA